MRSLAAQAPWHEGCGLGAQRRANHAREQMVVSRNAALMLVTLTRPRAIEAAVAAAEVTALATDTSYTLCEAGRIAAPLTADENPRRPDRDRALVLLVGPARLHGQPQRGGRADIVSWPPR